MRKLRNNLFVSNVILAGLCIITFASCNQKKEETKGNEYAVMKVTLSDKQLESHYSASIRGKQDVEIRPQVSGTITKVCMQEGADVKKDEPLFIIDQVPYQAALDIAVANVKLAEANVSTARLTADSKEELYNQEVVSDFEMKTAQNALQSALASLALAQAQEVNARNNLSYTVVKSPSTGIAGMTSYRVGALVSPSISVPLTTISNNSEIYAYFSMTEKQILTLSKEGLSLHDAIASMPEVDLLLSDGSTYGPKGKIDAISGIIDQTTGAISLRATFPNNDGILHSGGSANVVFPYVKNSCIVIPQAATFEVQDKKYVYTIEDGKAVSKMVSTFSINDGKEYIIEDGLKPGDVIVAEGVGLLHEGEPVTVKNEVKN